LGLGAVSVILAILFYLIVSETVPLNILTQFYSVYTALPVLYLGGVVTFRSWELKKGKEIHWEGAWIGTFYAIPKGLTWQEQYTYETSSESECEPETHRNRLLPTIHPRNRSDLGHEICRFMWFNLRPGATRTGKFSWKYPDPSSFAEEERFLT